MATRPEPMIETELAQYRFLHVLLSELDQVRDADKLLRHAARRLREFFRADEATVFEPHRGGLHFRGAALAGKMQPWPTQLLADYLSGARTHVPRNFLLARIPRRGRDWGALAVRRSQPFELGSARFLERVAAAVSRLLAQLDLARILEVRSRVDRKITEQLRPSDLLYQILDALRVLLEYDHSATVLLGDRAGQSLERIAEQVQWRRGGSRRIGQRLRLSASLRGRMRRGGVCAFIREPGGWLAGESGSADLLELAGLLAGSDARDGRDDPGPAALICAPLATRSGVLGLLAVSARSASAFAAWERDVLAAFVPHTSIATQVLHQTQSLERRVIETERRNAVAGLARGVSHDVNNALGAILPLVQQLAHETEEGRLDLAAAGRDLRQVEQSVQFCRRIFSGMLAFARRGNKRVGTGNLARAISSTLEMLSESMNRQNISVVVDCRDDLPAIRAGQGEIEQVLLNLAGNARDAMPEGGILTFRATREPQHIVLVVSDTGTGIPAEMLTRVVEPFFTTKAQGNGLGLSICRAILWEMRGDMRLVSEPGQGTQVHLRFPIVAPDSPGETDNSQVAPP